MRVVRGLRIERQRGGQALTRRQLRVDLRPGKERRELVVLGSDRGGEPVPVEPVTHRLLKEQTTLYQRATHSGIRIPERRAVYVAVYQQHAREEAVERGVQ